MTANTPHVLMTQSDPAQDRALQQLIEPYDIHLVFCKPDAGSILEQLQQRNYDAVVIRCGSTGLSCSALLSRYNLHRQASSPFSTKPAIPFLAILPAPDPARKQALLCSGYAAVLHLPLSEYRLACELSEHIRHRQEECAAQERALYNYFSLRLLTLGCPAHLHGFRYLCCCLVYLAEHPDAEHQLTQVLYPEVATQFNTSAGNLERSMRTALDHIQLHGDRQQLAELLPGHFNSDRKRSFCVRELLAALLRQSADMQQLG